MSSGTWVARGTAAYHSVENMPADRDTGNSSKVSRLKNVFQQSGDSGGRVNGGPVRGGGSVDPRSPERTRKKDEPDPNANSKLCKPAAEKVVNLNEVDPQKYFETTNHVQRFQHMRALFAQMEQKNQTDDAPRTRAPLRGTAAASRRARGASPSPHPRSSQGVETKRLSAVELEEADDLPPPKPHLHSMKPSTADTKPTITASKPTISPNKPRMPPIPRPKSESESSSDSSRKTLHGSMDSLESGSTASPRPTQSLSRSETDLTRPTYSSSTELLRQRFENRRSAPSTAAAPSPSPTPQQQQQNVHSSRFIKTEKPPAEEAPRPIRPSRLTDPPPEDTEVVMRNSYNHNDASSTSGSVLLLKRRSGGQENRLSKEDIEQSLAEADDYWQKMHGVRGESSYGMTESTYSSGSGEEMARSDSNHELSAPSPLTPDQDTMWSSIRSSGRDSDHSQGVNHDENSVVNGHPLSDYLDEGSIPQVTSDSDSLITPTQPNIPDDEEDSYEEAPEVITPVQDEVMPDEVIESVVKEKEVTVDEVTEDEVQEGEPPQVPTQPPPDENLLAPPIGLRKVASPSETSVSSMTPSEQDAFLSRADEELRVEEVPDQREEGDGHEEVPALVPDQTQAVIDDDGYHVFPDGSYMYEIEGIPELDANEDIYITAKEPSRIKFSQQPIKVFTTYSVDDYDRKNEDVDPMAASAEYELEKRVEKMDLFDVQLEKGSEGLGLSIIGMGVGADAGLEKLGIFIKTLNEGGAAQRDGRIQVNDQIIEVDGKSLVGVTQAYAGSVLRNTNGQVNFLIGREKDPSKSEVARLIQQSLEQDKRRNEVRKRELEERQRQLEQLQLQVEQQKQMHQDRQARGQTPQGQGQPSSPLEESESDDEPEYVSPHEHQDTEENQDGDEDEQTTAEVFNLDEGSSGESGDVTPEMNPQVLFIKLKEAQYKNAVSEAELAKLKAKMILLENADSQKKVFEKKYEDMASRLRETERNLTSTQKEITNYQEVLKGSQDHYVKLEQDIRDEYTQLEKKYHKSKKLIKDYQTRERDLLQEQESQYQQQSEKEQQYNQLVKSLKDKIFDLEKQLAEALKASGRSVPPPYSQTKIDMVMPVAVATSYQKPRPLETDNLSEVSETDSSPESSPEKVIAQGGSRPVNGAPSDTSYGQEDLDCVPYTELLDVSASKSKTHLASAGALAGRKQPSKTTSSTTSHESDEDYELDDSNLSITNMGDDVFLGPPPLPSSPPPHEELDAPQSTNVHLGSSAQDTDVVGDDHSDLDDYEFVIGVDPKDVLANRALTDVATEDVIVLSEDTYVEIEEIETQENVTRLDDIDSGGRVGDESVATLTAVGNGSLEGIGDSKETAQDQSDDDSHAGDDQSDTSSISQSSYDPSQPMFPSMGAEIPHVSPDTQEGGVMLISSRPRQDHSSIAPSAAGQPKALISGKASKAGGIQLISKKPVPNDFSADSGGIALLSTRSLDTGYGRGHLNTHSTDNLSASANMVAEYDLDNRAQKYDFTGATLTADDNSSVSSTGSTSKKNVAYQASPVHEWSPQQVCHWLLALELDQYAQEFMANNIDGVSLLAIDNNRLKVLGVSSSKDRDTIRRRVKELRSAMEKERKALEREQKAREKLEKQSNAGKKKKFPFTKA